jgi:MFS family permease
MEREKALRNVELYKWYRLLKEPLMWGPILISTLIHLGHMSLESIYFMEAVVLFGYIFLEAPSGALADLIGRKKMVVAGALFELMSICWFASIETPLDVWVANILWMIGSSFSSGANTSLIYDSLVELGEEYRFEQVEVQAVSYLLLGSALSSLFTGALAEVDLRLPILLSIPGVIVSVYITFCFTETGAFEEKVARKKFTFYELLCVLNAVTKGIHNLMKVSVLFVVNNKEVKWLVFCVTLVSVSAKVWFFTYNPYFELVNIDMRYYGVVFFFLNMITWYFCKHAYRIKSALGEKRVVILVLLGIGIPIIVMGSYISIFSVSFVLLQNVVRGMSSPFFTAFLHAHLTSEKRATVDSIKSTVSGIAQFVALSAFGFALTTFGLPMSLQILGGITTVLGVIGIYFYKKICS